MILAKYDPVVVEVFGHRVLQTTGTWEWALALVCPDKFLSKVSNM
jgi:hypothetical protein